MYTDFIYDFDGTLSDSYPIYASSFLALLKRYGIEDSYESVLQKLKVMVNYAVNSYPFHRPAAEIRDEYRSIREPMMYSDAYPFAGAKELLARVVACGGRNFLYTHSGQIAWDLLEKWDLKQYFAGGVTKDHGFPSKPAPDALNYLVETYGIDRDTAVMVGDRSIDLEAGKNAGIKGALFDPDNFYTDCPCEHRVTQLCELQALIKA